MDKKLILNLSTVVNGGAGHYALQNHRLLLQADYDSYLIVKEQPLTPLEKVIQYVPPKKERIWAKFKRRALRIVLNKFKYDDKYYFYNRFERLNCYSAKTILDLLPRFPDAIFVYWVSGFVNAQLLHELAYLTKAKIFILLIDDAPLSGGCHYPWDCSGFEGNCEQCPAIRNKLVRNIAKNNLTFKKKYRLPAATIITPTETDFERAQKSSLFHSNPCIKLFEIIDENRFKLAESKSEMKRYFHLHETEKIIFIGATHLNERRKGMKELLQALRLIKKTNTTLLVAGTSAIGDFPLPFHYTGYLSEDELIKAYQAADIFVCPSLEDAGPLMINQSIMCGTPVVAFDMGSARDLVITGKTGYKALYSDVADMANGIDYLLSLDTEAYTTMSTECRKLALASFSTNVFLKTIEKIIN